MTYVRSACCDAMIGAPHAFGCDDAHDDSADDSSVFGRHLTSAFLAFGLYSYDEAAEMEREATAHLEASR